MYAHSKKYFVKIIFRKVGKSYMKGNCQYVIVERTSKNGNTYKSLELHFENGYVMVAVAFLTNEQIYILESLTKNEGI